MFQPDCKVLRFAGEAAIDVHLGKFRVVDAFGKDELKISLKLINTSVRMKTPQFLRCGAMD